MATWVERYEVPGSNGAVWTVGIDKDGNYGCSCPVWKFKRQVCKHIRFVQDNRIARGEDDLPHYPMQPGNVGEVTIKNGVVLYPLVPLGWNYTAHLICTIIYDLIRAKADAREIVNYKNRMAKAASISEINSYIENHGRLVYEKFVKGEGWINPITVPYNTPIRVIGEEVNDIIPSGNQAVNANKIEGG